MFTLNYDIHDFLCTTDIKSLRQEAYGECLLWMVEERIYFSCFPCFLIDDFLVHFLRSGYFLPIQVEHKFRGNFEVGFFLF